ncbi:hypothetical protein EVAR_70661_1, partial [Eumeta japonica]
MSAVTLKAQATCWRRKLRLSFWLRAHHEAVVNMKFLLLLAAGLVLATAAPGQQVPAASPRVVCYYDSKSYTRE